jgi:hypothetical protein
MRINTSLVAGIVFTPAMLLLGFNANAAAKEASKNPKSCSSCLMVSV